MATRYLLDHAPESVKVKYVKFKKMPGEVIVVDPKDVDLDEVEVIGRVDMRQGKFKGGEECGYIQFDHEDEDTAYDLYKKSKGKVVGYLLARDGGVIAVEKESSFILLILFLLLKLLNQMQKFFSWQKSLFRTQLLFQKKLYCAVMKEQEKNKQKFQFLSKGKSQTLVLLI